MNRKSKILSVLVAVGFLALGIGWGSSVYASQEEKKAANKSVKEFVAAFEKHDATEMVKYVKDSRVKNDAELLSSFQEFSKHDAEDHTQLKLVNIVEISSGGYEATFQEKSDRMSVADFTMPLIKENGEWKIQIYGTKVIEPNDKNINKQ